MELDINPDLLGIHSIHILPKGHLRSPLRRLNSQSGQGNLLPAISLDCPGEEEEQEGKFLCYVHV